MKPQERERLTGLWTFDCKKGQGRPVFGIDEVGRGPLAGPVVAACAYMPETLIEGVKDSKKVTEAKREALFDCLCQGAVAFGVGMASVEEIEAYNILNATKLAMLRAYQKMPEVSQSYVLIDALAPTILPAEGEGIIGGDGQSYAIAAASLIAKVTRDRLMITYEAQYPGYGFKQHKGYATKQHREAILALGPTPIHRRSFLKGIWHE